jgi:rfaE bifunctional protein kinase chain/domain/rfaE bifunctional protein nucleotidyltransferase chain/domain
MKNYLDKILSAKEIIKKIGTFPRANKSKVSMCHGVFDLVHPGHIRHLTYTKSKSSILIVSITSDIHVKKADLRPYVPQKLRAENLAALEFVDYVLIDQNETPLENIKKIKPDYFVKGYEYITSRKDNPKTIEEKNILKSYGGQFLFTPGDYIMSSSSIIQNENPDLSLIKLKSLIEGEKISFKKIFETLKKIDKAEVLVVGDTIVDTYVNTSLLGSNAKTPTFSTKFLNEKKYVGGAAIVAQHLKAAGANVKFCSVLGKDNLSTFVKSEIKKSGIKDLTITDDRRPTTEKKYYIADSYRLLKVDTVENSPINNDILKKICTHIKNHKKGIVIFSDFRHGIFSEESIKSLKLSINKGVFKVGDSQVASRWGNILDFSNFDLITPNEREVRFALADQDSSIRPLATKLYDKAKCKTLIFKLGAKGILTLRRKFSKKDLRSFFVIDALEKNAVDPVGCGDALISYASLGLYISKNPLIASILGSISASIACKINGNLPVSKKQVKKKLDQIQDELSSLT